MANMLQQYLLEIASPVVLFSTSVLIALFVYKYFIYPAFISPLAKIPNVHFTSPFSEYWIKSQHRQGKTGTRALLVAHERYGPVVRISPNELSISSLDGLRQAYTGGFEKTSYYHGFQNYGTENLVSMIHNRPHATQKRMISNVYSKSYIQSSLDLQILSRAILHDRLFPLLEDVARSGAQLDAYKLNIALGADFMNAYLFGSANGTNFIRDSASLEEILAPFNTYFHDFNFFNDLSGKKAAGKKVEDHILAMCTAAEGVSQPPYSFSMSLPPTQPVVYSQLLSRLSKDSTSRTVAPRIAAASEMMDQIAAAIETTKVTLTYVQWELSQRPELARDLHSELLTLDPPLRYNADDTNPLELPDAKAIDALPLLNAILKEVLRLYTPAPAMFPRMTPPEGTVIDGCKIPGGVSVSASAYCLHRHSAVFPDGGTFNPNRWMNDNTKGVDGGPGPKSEQNKWFWAFGSGGRMCIGSHYSVYMLKLCIAAIYTNYSTTIIDDTGIEQEDAFIAAPKGETLILEVRRRS